MRNFNKKRHNRQQEERRKLIHLSNVVKNAETLVNNGVLRVLPELNEAYFPREIWDSKDEETKNNLVANITLYVFSLNTAKSENAEMKLELYDFENNALASYMLDQPILYT